MFHVQSFHIAGDGKLGGLVDPNDGRCHLNSSGFYTKSREQDYPSLGHIASVARQNIVNIISDKGKKHGQSMKASRKRANETGKGN